MMRWMMDHDRVDKRYLSFPNQKAAAVDDHLTWSDATYLVRQDNRKFLRPAEAKVPGDDKGFVVWKDAAPHECNTVATADLEFSGDVNGIAVKTVYSLLKERVNERTVKEYAQICGVDPEVIEHVADDFSSVGRQATADFYRGAAQHTNGTYTSRTLTVLNFLIGNVSWKGGCEAHGGGHWAKWAAAGQQVQPGQRPPSRQGKNCRYQPRSAQKPV